MKNKYIKVMEYFVKHDECMEVGDMCADCPITKTCDTPTDVDDAKKWLINQSPIEQEGK